MMFLDSIVELLVMQSTVTSIPPIMRDVMNHVPLGCSVNRSWVSPCQFKEHDLPDLETVGHVRAENFQLSLYLHHRHP